MKQIGGLKPHANVTTNKHVAAKVMLTFSTPLPENAAGVPTLHDCARVLGVPHTTLSQEILIKKCRQLTAGEKGLYWALTKRKKGYSTLNKELRLLLGAAFNNHPHIIVLSNAKDMLQVKDANGEKVSVCKVLTQVSLGTIFSDIFRYN
jgi:hypothetical protein